MSRSQAAAMVEVHTPAHRRAGGARAELDRELEVLPRTPSDRTRPARAGLDRPELAELLAYAKLS